MLSRSRPSNSYLGIRVHQLRVHFDVLHLPPHHEQVLYQFVVAAHLPGGLDHLLVPGGVVCPQVRPDGVRHQLLVQLGVA